MGEVAVFTGFLAAAVRIATPLLLTATGEAVSQRGGTINLGLEGAPGVDHLVPILKPYKLASLQYKREQRTVLEIDGRRIGGDHFATIAGPCTVESREVLLDELRILLEKQNITLLGELGFENAYALVMPRKRAEQLGIRTIADLAARAPGMSIAGDYEFFSRPEWASLRKTYGLSFRAQRQMQPDFMYAAAASGEPRTSPCAAPPAPTRRRTRAASTTCCLPGSGPSSTPATATITSISACPATRRSSAAAGTS